MPGSRGRTGGRKKKLSEADIAAAQAMLRQGEVSVAAIAKRLNISRQGLYQDFPAARKNASKQNALP